ncbi:LysR family transcriptional regulator [Polaromonas glacialis]|uniref:LysR family transcriptional regulator n=1 Tax=Polaromonas glacialis TaxID=866564 RepID=UPI000496969B|nr:LysR family transcriptional regulator [Polaromonas glacialis]
MDMLLKLKAFIATADAGNFSAAARNSYASPSVMMKRVDALEWDFKTTLFDRSTRRLTLTNTGQSYLIHARQLIRSYNDMVSGAILSPGSIEGPIRIKAPAVLIRQGLSDLFAVYRAQNPLVHFEIIASDRGGNPATEGFDIAVGMDQMAYPDVIEQVIRPFPRLLCAAPAYLAQCDAPLHPRDLIHHPCLAFSLAGPIWGFNSPDGRIEVDVRPVLKTNDAGYLCAAACDGQGIVQLALPIVADALLAGQLVPVLEQFPLVERWVKIMVPTARLELMRVKLLFDRMVQHLASASGARMDCY